MNRTSPPCEEQAATAADLLAFIEPRAWLAEPPAAAESQLRGHLAHRISRNPGDLLAHVQRIQLCIRARASDELYGALLDLFIALGGKGRALRGRLLARCRPLLAAPQREALARGVSAGIAATDVVPEAQHSRFCAAVRGTLLLVSQAESKQAPPAFDVVDEARDLLDSGQILAARTLLERTLLDQPRNLMVGQELLSIYRHSRDHAGLNSMLQKMAGMPLAGRQEWLALAASLETAPAAGAAHG